MGYKVSVIEPVTRIEGDARVVIVLDENGNVRDVYYQSLEFRGFEAFCRGRYAEEMPRIASAICGVCSIPHHMASAKAVDALFGRKPPKPAVRIRELVYNVYMIDDHLLHFTVMALPDFVEGENTPSAGGLAKALAKEPKIVKQFLQAKTLTRRILERLAGKNVQMSLCTPGGVAKKLTKEDLDFINSNVKELEHHLHYFLDSFKSIVTKSNTFKEHVRTDEYVINTYHMGLVGEDDTLTFYDGLVKIVDHKGREVTKFAPDEYTKYLAEHYEEWSYAKFPYLLTLGSSGDSLIEPNLIRVGPLSRLNVCSKIPTPWANNEFKTMLEFFDNIKPINNTLAYHWARMIENVYAYETLSKILSEESDILLSENVMSFEGEPKLEGVGIVEAARGILIHHYKTDASFIIKDVNVITPTAINNSAINIQLKKIAQKMLKPTQDDETVLNKLEVAIRAFDPCTSCATHSIRNHFIKVFVYDSYGQLIKVMPGRRG